MKTLIEATLAISGLIIGIIFGFVLQRGRFCMNSAFRDIIVLKEYTLIKAVALAILVMLIGFHLLATAGSIQLNPKPLYWGAMIFGGFIFGIGMVLAAGCASGTTYRVGEGMMGSLIALIGLMIGGLVTSGGVLSELNSSLKSDIFQVITTGDLGIDPGPYITEGNTSLTLANIFGLNPWIFVAIISIIILAVLYWKRGDEGTEIEGSFYEKTFKQGWSWWVTGIAIGIVGILAFLAFQKYALGISGGWFAFLNTLILGDLEKLNWFTFLVIGTVAGDMHNLGKIMVNATLRGGGFDVIDLGEDVSKETFIKTVKEEKPDILGLGCYMTTTMLEMKEIINQLENEGLRNNVKVIIGGVPCTQEFADEIKADAWGKDAFDAVEKAKQVMG